MNELLSLARMARRAGVTQQWLREQANAGVIPCLRVGNRYLFNMVAADTALLELAAASRANRKGVDHAD